MALAQERYEQTHTLEQRAEQYQEERRYIVKVPVAHYYALLVGMALLPLGILGFIPPLTRGGILLGIMRISPFVSALHLVTGIAGIAAFAFRRGRYAHDFTLVLTGVYLLLFSHGNTDFGNAEGAAGGPPNIPWILENALHAGLMLTGALITGLATLQRGDRATAREFEERYGITDPRADASAGKHVGPRLPSLRASAAGMRHAIHNLPARIGRGVALVSLSLLVTLLAPLVRRSWYRLRTERDDGAMDTMDSMDHHRRASS